MPGDNTRGCIVCNVVVRKPALLCTDCGGDANGSMQGNQDLLVFLREDGPVEVTREMLTEAFKVLDTGGGHAYGFERHLVDRLLAWLRDNTVYNHEVAVD